MGRIKDEQRLTKQLVDVKGRIKYERYASGLPRNLLEKYRLSESDPHILSMREEISLTTAILKSLLERKDPTAAERKEIINLLAAKRKLVEAERAYMIERGMMISYKQLLRLLSYLQQIIFEEIEDEDRRQKIAHRIRRDLLLSYKPPVDFDYKPENWDMIVEGEIVQETPVEDSGRGTF